MQILTQLNKNALATEQSRQFHNPKGNQCRWHMQCKALV